LGAVIAGLPLILFAINAARYMLDATPLLSIAGIAGSWVYLDLQRQRPVQGWVATILILLISLATLTIGILLAVTGFEARFERLNPDLFDRITRFLAW
jgi:hypothetical protein